MAIRGLTIMADCVVSMKTLRRSGRWRSWQPNRECSPLTQLACGHDISVHGLHQVLYDRQPEPRAAQFTRTGLIDAVKTLENAGKVGFGNANSAIFDFQAK